MRTFPFSLLLCFIAMIGVVSCTVTDAPEVLEPTSTLTVALAPETAAPTAAFTPIPPTMPERTIIPERTTMPERIPPTVTDTAVTGEVPVELLDAVKADLSERTGATLDQINVARAQAITWPDGSLGCPQPGVFYTQALVNGYWVVLEAGDQEYDYRLADTGYFFVCQGGFPPVAPHGTPDS